MSTHVSLSFSGGLAEERTVDFYDLSRALIGFQRSLALTTHLVLNDEVIVQAPSLRGASVLATIPEPGSWKITAVVIGGVLSGAYAIGTAPTDTPLGHIISSAYDYVVSETLGFHVDYGETLGETYERHNEALQDIPKLEQHRFDSLREKCEPAIKDMHRPISHSETATNAGLVATVGRREIPFHHPLTRQTYEYLEETRVTDRPREFRGRVTSYNSNTYKGRIYVPALRRPIPFVLAGDARFAGAIGKVTRSLDISAQRRNAEDAGVIVVQAFESLSRSDQLKSITIVEIE